MEQIKENSKNYAPAVKPKIDQTSEPAPPATTNRSTKVP